jgi:hypothetical protein
MWPQLQSFNDDDQFIATLTDLNIVPTLTGCCWQHILNFGLHTMFESRFTVATIVKKEIKLGGSITLWNQLLLFQSVALQVAPLVQVKQLSDIHHLLLIREGFRCYFGPLVACYQPTGWPVPNESKGPYEINILPPSPLLQTDYRDLFVPEHTLLCQTTTAQFQIREPLYVVQGHCYQFRSKWLAMADMGQYISASIGDLNSQLHGHPFNVNTALMYLLLSYNLLIVWLDGKHTLQVFRWEFQFMSDAMAEQQLQTYLNQSRLRLCLDGENFCKMLL